MVPTAAIYRSNAWAHIRINIVLCFIGVLSFFTKLLCLSKKLENATTRPITTKRIEPFTPFGLNSLHDGEMFQRGNGLKKNVIRHRSVFESAESLGRVKETGARNL